MVIFCKKDQTSGISSPKITLYRAGNTTNLVFLKETSHRELPGGFLMSLRLMHYKRTTGYVALFRFLDF
jgi:hypothetical protein